VDIQTPHVGFAQFLFLVASFDWENCPLIVNFELDKEVDEDRRRLVQASFEGNHKRRGSCFWVSSQFDPHSAIIPFPAPVVAHRFLALCRAGNDRLTSSVSERINLNSMFEPDLFSFDVVVHLNKASIVMKGLQPTCSLPEEPTTRSDVLRRMFFEYVRNLSTYFGNAGVVAYNVLEFPYPNKVAIKFRPSSFLLNSGTKPTTLPACIIQSSTNHGPDKMPISTLPNVVILSASLASIGIGLVKRVEFLDQFPNFDVNKR